MGSHKVWCKEMPDTALQGAAGMWSRSGRHGSVDTAGTCGGQGSHSECLQRTDSESQLPWCKKINKQTTNVK